MNCDPLAKIYKPVEYAAFGRRLERQRFHYIPALASSKRILILGEGDGRFLQRLLTANASAGIDCIDSSQRMLDAARNRVGGSSRVNFIHADATTFRLNPSYDAVVTNFFLDCFSQSEADALIARIAASCAPSARWIISDFVLPDSGWRRLHALAWLRTMYLFFHLATGLKTRTLPQHCDEMQRHGFIRISEFVTFAGMIRSELWQLGL